MRHPDVLKYVDAIESDNSIFIVTERVRPLIGAEELGNGQSKEDWIIWGVHRISVRSSPVAFVPIMLIREIGSLGIY